jgi:hypothetical protein
VFSARAIRRITNGKKELLTMPARTGSRKVFLKSIEVRIKISLLVAGFKQLISKD